jgi:hypothetical protein
VMKPHVSGADRPEDPTLPALWHKSQRSI